MSCRIPASKLASSLGCRKQNHPNKETSKKAPLSGVANISTPEQELRKLQLDQLEPGADLQDYRPLLHKIHPSWYITNICDKLFAVFAELETEPPGTSRLSPNLLYFATPSTELEPPFFESSQSAAQELCQLEDYNGGMTILKKTLMDYFDGKHVGAFITLDANLAHTFARAKALNLEFPANDLTIGAVDVTKVGKDCLVSCRSLQKRLEIHSGDQYNSKVLAWARLPEEAVVFSMKWDTVTDSRIAQRWFPILGIEEPEPAVIDVGRRWEADPSLFENRHLEAKEVLEYLVEDLGFPKHEKYTFQLAVTFLAWSWGKLGLEGHETVKYLVDDAGELVFEVATAGERNLSAGVSTGRPTTILPHSLGRESTPSLGVKERVWWKSPSLGVKERVWWKQTTS